MNLSSSLLFCLAAASLLCLASSQAPGDGEQKCTSLDSHPGYSEYVRPLMDSRDYPGLLPHVWSELNLDENKRVGVQTEVGDHEYFPSNDNHVLLLLYTKANLLCIYI